VLGDIGDKDTENEMLLVEHDIPHASFSPDVLACLPQTPWTINDEVSACRPHEWKLVIYQGKSCYRKLCCWCTLLETREWGLRNILLNVWNL